MIQEQGARSFSWTHGWVFVEPEAEFGEFWSWSSAGGDASSALSSANWSEAGRRGAGVTLSCT